jgi:uncharacterized protein (DUF3820 family)
VQVVGQPVQDADHAALLIKLVNTKMPFGRFKGRKLLDLPEPYVVWFKNQGFPKGTLGEQLAVLYEIKVNGLEPLLRPLVEEG